MFQWRCREITSETHTLVIFSTCSHVHLIIRHARSVVNMFLNWTHVGKHFWSARQHESFLVSTTHTVTCDRDYGHPILGHKSRIAHINPMSVSHMCGCVAHVFVADITHVWHVWWCEEINERLMNCMQITNDEFANLPSKCLKKSIR